MHQKQRIEETGKEEEENNRNRKQNTQKIMQLLLKT
jgi:hypothetical protein